MLTDRKAFGFKDVLIVPQASDIRSRKEVSLEREFTFRNGLKKTFVPIMAANMANIGTFKVAHILSKYKMLTCIVKDTSYEEYEAFYGYSPEIFPYLATTIGLKEPKFLAKLLDAFPIDIICIDVANGYMDQFTESVYRIGERYPEQIIIAGNVATAEGAQKLYEAGADVIKVGIGSGSVCTTRYKTGVGIPQITAIDDVLAPVKGPILDYLVCSDGGCTGPGDVAKAFVAGADFVMLGGMLAGTDETGQTFSGSAFGNTKDYKTDEGKTVSVHRDGSLDSRISSILGGLRSCGSYIGQKKIEDFYKADLIQVLEQTNDVYGGPC